MFTEFSRKLLIFQNEFLLKFWHCSGAEVCKSCRAWKMLSNAYFLAKSRFDTAENEPAKNLQNFADFPNFANPSFIGQSSNGPPLSQLFFPLCRPRACRTRSCTSTKSPASLRSSEMRIPAPAAVSEMILPWMPRCRAGCAADRLSLCAWQTAATG